MCAESMAAMPPTDLTTRVVVPQPEAGTDYEWLWRDRRGYDDVSLASLLIQHAPYHVGERVALTETWRATDVLPGPDCDWFEYRIEYRAGGYARWVRLSDVRSRELSVVPCLHAPWVPAFLMPADLARRFGIITSVAAGRLYDMTDADYVREGVPTLPWFKGDLLAAWIQWWDKLDGHRYPYASNPWTFHCGFEETHGIRQGHS